MGLHSAELVCGPTVKKKKNGNYIPSCSETGTDAIIP